jgi:hypothetical protein
VVSSGTDSTRAISPPLERAARAEPVAGGALVAVVAGGAQEAARRRIDARRERRRTGAV